MEQATLDRFRPVCVTLTKEHTTENVAALQKELTKTKSPQLLQEMQEYLLFPLRLILKQSKNKNEQFYCDVIHTMTAVLTKTAVERWELFQDIFTSLCIFISSTEHKVAPLCEELKLAVVRCLCQLSHTTSSKVFAEKVYQPQFIPALGHAVSLLLHLVETERLKDLRLASITTLCELAGTGRKITGRQRGDTLAAILPGITMSLAKVATGDSKQGHKIITSAIEAWAKIVCFVLSDKDLNSENPSMSSSSSNNDSYQKLVVSRTKQWVDETASKLKILVHKLIPLASADNWRVRLAMVEWAKALLTNCSGSLEVCLSDIMEVLVGRVSDDYPAVSQAATAALTDFQSAKMSGSKPVKSLVEILEESLHKLATSLPRMMRLNDDSEKLATLKLFNGYLSLLGPHINTLLRSSAHLQRISTALLQSFELDCTGVKMIQEESPADPYEDIGVDSTTAKIRKYFLHFSNDRVYEELTATCRLLGRNGDPNLLVDHFLEKFVQSSVLRKQATIIVNEIILGMQENQTHEDLFNIIQTVTEEYLQLEHWHLATNASETEHVKQINSNVLQICLLLEGIGNCATTTKTAFKPLFTTVLYPVLEKLGDERSAISSTAHIVLQEIARNCGYKSIPEVLCDNADYIVNDISLRLRHLTHNLQAPVVLRVILVYGGRDVLPLVEDTVQEILRSLDTHHATRTKLFLDVLHALVSSILEWFRDGSVPGDVDKPLNELNICPKQELSDYFKDYLKQREVAEDLEADTDGTIDLDVEEHEEPKKDPPKHVKMVKEVMQRCCHLLASPHPRIRLLVLKTIGQAALALRSSQDELLPLVHKVWPAFALRFSDEEQLVVIKAFDVLKILATTSGDFIRQRTQKDVLPRLASTLAKLSRSSSRVGPSYQFTMACKLQMAILGNIGNICETVGLQEQTLSPIILSVVPYLSSKQHPVLQSAALRAFRGFVRQEPDTVWLFMKDLYSPNPLLPPSESFKEIKMAGSKMKNEYSDNVDKVLSML